MAQDQPGRFSIRDFSKGMASSVNPFLAGNQLQSCQGWQLSKRMGSLTLQKGYTVIDSLYALPGGETNPVYGIYGHYQSNGKKMLFAVVPNGSTGWGRLVHSRPDEYEIDTVSEGLFGTDDRHVRNYIDITNMPWWASWRDMVFMTNSRQIPIVWVDSSDTCKDYAVPLSGYTPGTSEYMAIDSGGNLDGTYWYAWTTRQAPCSLSDAWNTHFGLPIGPVNVNDGSIMHYSFPRVGKNFYCSLAADTFSSLALWRTKAEPAIDINTKLPGEMTRFYKIIEFDSLTPAMCRDAYWVDEVPDSSLGVTPYDTSQVYYEFPAYGVPGKAEIAASNEGTGKGLFFRQGDSSTQYFYYAVTFYDTLLGIESNMGKLNRLGNTSTDSNYTLWLPPVPYHMENTVRILYRGWDVFSYDYDSVVYSVGDRGLTSMGRRLAGMIYIGSVVKYVESGETWQMRTFYPVDTIAMPTDTITDEMDYAELILRKPYEPNSVMNFDGMTAVNDRMWAWEGSKLYFSDLDTATRWGAFQYVSFNMDDGEDITVVVPTRGDLAVYKPSNSFILYQDADGGYTRSWMIPSIGCINKFSMVAVGDARFYQAMDGFYQEQGLPYKDRGASIKKISLPIQNILDAWTLAEKKNCYGLRNGDEIWFSFPNKDTTLVYNMMTEGWTIMDYGFTQSTTYDTLSVTKGYRSNDIIFLRPDSSNLYLADSGYVMSIGTPQFTLPRLMFDDYYGIKELRLWTNHVYDSGGIKIIISNPVSGEADTVSQGPLLDDLIVFRGMTVTGYMLDVLIKPYVHQTSDSTTVSIRDFEINGIDIWTEKKATVESE